MGVIWKPIPQWESYYEVSDRGGIKRIAPGAGAREGHILQPSTVSGGYKMVRLSRPEFEQTYQVHRLVLAAFVGPCPDGMEANHINGIRDDNRLANLEWVTRGANLTHSYRVLGRAALSGSKNPAARLTEADVISIKAGLNAGRSYSDIAKEYRVSKGAVAHIAQGRTWRGG